MVVEVDGKIHDFQKEKDNLRRQWLESIGLKVIRFRNEKVFGNIEVVKQKIEGVLKKAQSS